MEWAHLLHLGRHLINLQFGAGLALFNKHLPSLAEHVSDDTRCLALDLLGMARSSRIRCPVDAKTKKGRADQAEAFFVKSLEAWRLALGIERITFIAHSLGKTSSKQFCRQLIWEQALTSLLPTP